jgi:Cu-Zn family superoxide dismutase
MNNLTRAFTVLSFTGITASLSPGATAWAASPATATATAPIVIQMNIVDAQGKATPAGTITATNTGYGLMLKPALTGLPPGLHGFHLHENPSCDPAPKDGQPAAAQAAGGHYDPAKTNRHEGPYGNGHLGDLPAIYVGPDGKADYPILAPRLKVADLPGHSLMVHAGGDNHADHPAPLGGGGVRIACGVVPDAKP